MSDDTGPEPATPCRYCGSDATDREAKADADQPNDGTEVYQVIVLCAACRRPFATIARN